MSIKKILIVMDHLGSGGAQRQIINVAKGLKDKGYSIDLFVYYPNINFYDSEINLQGVRIIRYNKKNKGFSLKTLQTIRRQLKQNNYNIALSFLDTPNTYLMLAKLGLRVNTKIVVSERSSFLKSKWFFLLFFKKQVLRLADAVITNSFSQSNWLVQKALLPSRKIVTIYNGFESDSVRHTINYPGQEHNLKIVGVSSIRRLKNIHSLIEALNLFCQNHNWCPEVTWVGKILDSNYYQELNNQLDLYPEVKKKWFWAGERTDVYSIIEQNHLLILPSHYEGLPNVICESFLSGRPVLASDVCDNPLLVKSGERGFLFNPYDPKTIMKSVESILKLNKARWIDMSHNCRCYAENNLDLKYMANNYESLFFSLTDGKET